MQSQYSSPRTGMNWLYFATNFLVCLAVLFAAKYALDMLAGHATSHFRSLPLTYRQASRSQPFWYNASAHDWGRYFSSVSFLKSCVAFNDRSSC